MFKDIENQIEQLNQKRNYFDADLDTSGKIALLEFYVKIVPKVLNAERCSIFIYDPDSKTIWLKCGTELEERDIEVTTEYDSVVVNVITSGQHKFVTGLDKRNGTHKQTDENTGFVTRDILCIPIKSLDSAEVTGAVEILNKKGGGSFNDDDRILLEEMAHFLELTIENIFFNQETANVLDNIHNMMKKVVFVFIAIIISLIIIFSIF
jgi:GAF domain-containing protein